MNVTRPARARHPVEGSPAERSESWPAAGSELIPWLLPVLVIGLLASPLVVAGGAFSGDWPTHLWFTWHQGDTLAHGLRPSLFLHYDGGVFYPQFAFYGGTLYAVGGAVSAVFGGAGRSGYVLGWVLAMVAAYGGWTWLGRMAGLGRWTAQAPAVLFVCSPYLLTTAYARGDWPEFVAVSVTPLLIASAVSVLRADRLRLGPAAALAASTTIFSGSHNLTLLWGATLLAIAAGALVACVPALRHGLTRGAVLRLVAIVLPAGLVNAWFLLPDVVYQSHTVIAFRSDEWRYLVEQRMGLVSAGHLFTLGRSTASATSPGFVLALPVLAIAWILVSGALVSRQAWATTWLRILATLAALATALTVLMVSAGLVLALPKPYVMIQFTYRIETYILLAVAGGLLAALVLLRDAPSGPRRWRWVLAGILALWMAGAVGQVYDRPGDAKLSAFSRPTIGSLGDFSDANATELPRTRLAKVTFPPGDVHHDRVTVTAPVAPGQVVDSNLMTVSPLVHIEGARIVGAHTFQRDNDVRRLAVLQVDRTATPGAARITISAAHPPAVTIGKLLSLLGIASLLVTFAALVARRSQRSA